MYSIKNRCEAKTPGRCIYVDSSNDNLYAFWIRSSDIFYKKGTHSGGSWTWDTDPTSWQASGTNVYCTSNFTASTRIFVLWSDGSGTSYNIQWAKLTLNSAPTAPTVLYLSETYFGAQYGYATPVAVGDSTPVFSAQNNDPDSGDYATKYEIIVYSASGCTTSQVWDSGSEGTEMTPCMEGNQCYDGLDFAGTPLSFEGRIYYWKIRFWDDDNTVGAWSGCSTFTMLAFTDQMRHGKYHFNREIKRVFSW